jgi:protein gp37
VDWVIVGGESGGGARPFNLEWGQILVNQCRATGTPCFVKQLGAKPVHYSIGDIGSYPITDHKGGDMDEWPLDLRVRQFPVVGHVASLR